MPAESRSSGSRSCGGNALFLILIAVALFAALSYAVTKSGRSGGSISREQAKIYAALIVQSANMVAQGVTRMVLSGTPATSIVVGTPPGNWFPGSGTVNGNGDLCTTGTTCLFAPDGGGVLIPKPPQAAYVAAYSAWPIAAGYFTGANGYNGVLFQENGDKLNAPRNAFGGIGTAAADDEIEFFPLRKEVCQAINDGLGISGIPFWSTSGEPATCSDWIGDGSLYVFYQVVVPN